jgi:hypothetical protein
MADPKIVITLGDEEFSLAGASAQEVLKVKTWTGYRNRRAWFDGITDEQPEALLAALCIAKQRKGEQVDYYAVDIDLDTLEGKFIDDQGREVEPVLELKDDGTLKTDKDGDPIPVTDKDGKPQWRDVVSGDVIPFGISESKTTSTTPLKRGSSSVSAGGESKTA